MSTIFPSGIDTNITLPLVIDNTTSVSAATVNQLQNTIIVIESNVGTNAQSVYGTIAQRLSAIEAILQSIISSGTGPISPVFFNGDIQGTNTRQVIVGLQNRPLSSANPTTGQAIIWSGSTWAPTTIPSATTISLGLVQLTRDLAGTSSAPQVVGIRGTNIQNAAPTDKSVLIYDVSTSQFLIRPLTSADLATPFTITSFTMSGANAVEVGTTVVNPTFFNTFSSTPTSAFITNTDLISSPTIEVSPWNGAVVSGSFVHNTINASVTFTLTASDGSGTQQATQTIQYQGRSFFGIGTSGATSATASGSNAILVAATGTLSITGIFPSIPGQSFGPVTPTAQKIYFLTPHTSTPHTFIDQFTFPFSFFAPTIFSFTNQNSIVLSYDLYESVNSLSTSFTILAVS
jgi:hypothetical protein